MIDPQRLDRIVDALLADPAYGAGSRTFSGGVADDEAEVIAEGLGEQMDEGAAARSEQAAVQGFRIACGPGCSACCEVMVMVYRPEAIRIARFLAQPEHHALRAAFLDEHRRWRSAVGDSPTVIAALSAAADRGPYYAALSEHWQRRILCAFNRDGQCLVYPVRPLGCRNAHALDTADHCVAATALVRPAAALAFPPLDRFLATATALLRALQTSMGGPHGEATSVSDAVYALLDGERAAPGD